MRLMPRSTASGGAELTGGWAPRRFWTSARAEPVPGGFTVFLDARPLRTPAKAPLIVPTRALAEAIAAEWNAQGKTIDPHAMPLTRYANSAIDKVGPQFAEVAALVAAYGESDLLCYRAAGPEALRHRQAAAWDPLLRWAAEALGAPLAVTTGVVPVPQPADSVAALARAVHGLSPFGLAALHDLVAISGSLVIGLAVTRGLAAPEALWAASRIDEDWQAGQWGRDDEAAAVAAAKREGFLEAWRLWRLLDPEN